MIHCFCVSAYSYDHRGRMVSKRITENDGSDTLVKSTAYLWDNWNIIRETQVLGTRDQGSGTGETLATSHCPLVTDYAWGLDIDSTLQGAGGVGGLLAVVRSDCAATNSAFCIRHSALYLPTYDANGNISEYISESGEVVAHYDYSPFGETLIESGDMAGDFTHRFSTKPWCPITGLYEYQMRRYRPEIGRWLSRDIDFEGRDKILNDNLFLKNSPVSVFDYLGLRGMNSRRRRLPGKFHYKKSGVANGLEFFFDKFYRTNSYETLLRKGFDACNRRSPREKSGCRCCVIFFTYTGGLHAGEAFYFSDAEVYDDTCEEVERRGFWLNPATYLEYNPW